MISPISTWKRVRRPRLKWAPGLPEVSRKKRNRSATWPLFSRTDTGENAMPQGDKSSYTDKQKRQARHIEHFFEDRGVSKKEAEGRAWATVNKESGGGK